MTPVWLMLRCAAPTGAEVGTEVGTEVGDGNILRSGCVSRVKAWDVSIGVLSSG